MPKIQGRIIRILDTRTAIINLGSTNGVKSSSVFHILGDPEAIIDPFSKEELGQIVVVKSKLKAEQVYEKFTIATTKWTIVTLKHLGSSNYNILDIANHLGFQREVEVVDHGEMKVRSEDIKPWKAKSETPVRVGDIVEVEVQVEKPNSQEENKVTDNENTDEESEEKL